MYPEKTNEGPALNSDYSNTKFTLFFSIGVYYPI